jgi:hypothetical protein
MNKKCKINLKTIKKGKAKNKQILHWIINQYNKINYITKHLIIINNNIQIITLFQ